MGFGAHIIIATYGPDPKFGTRCFLGLVLFVFWILYFSTKVAHFWVYLIQQKCTEILPKIACAEHWDLLIATGAAAPGRESLLVQ